MDESRIRGSVNLYKNVNVNVNVNVNLELFNISNALGTYRYPF